MISKAAMFFIKILFVAALPKPVTSAVGVASPNAQGHAITKTETIVINEVVKLPVAKYQPKKVEMPIVKTVGTKYNAILSTNFELVLFLFVLFLLNL